MLFIIVKVHKTMTWQYQYRHNNNAYLAERQTMLCMYILQVNKRIDYLLK